MIGRMIAVGLAAGMSVSASAAPVYLKCYFDVDGTIASIDVTADEDDGTVAVHIPTSGFSERLNATFTASQVIFRNNLISYVINRVDLTINRTVRMLNSIDRGQCEVQEAPRRAF